MASNANFKEALLWRGDSVEWGTPLHPNSPGSLFLGYECTWEKPRSTAETKFTPGITRSARPAGKLFLQNTSDVEDGIIYVRRRRIKREFFSLRSKRFRGAKSKLNGGLAKPYSSLFVPQKRLLRRLRIYLCVTLGSAIAPKWQEAANWGHGILKMDTENIYSLIYLRTY